jgi:glutaredoxin
MEARRCTIHGLVAADDGRCVICRRGDAAVDSEPQGMSATTMVIALGGCALGGVIAFWINQDPPKRPIVIDPPKIVQTQPVAAPLPPPPHAQPIPVAPQPQATAVVDQTVGGDVPEDPKLTAAKQHVSITMYTSDACVYCTASKVWLGRHQYRYTELNIDNSETDKVEMQALNPAISVQTFNVGGVPVVGFDAVLIDSTI